MGIQLPKEKYSEAPIAGPKQTVRALATRFGKKVDSFKVPQYMLLSLSVGATESLVRALNAEEMRWLYRARPLYVGNIHTLPVGTIWAAPGAPLAAMVTEDLIACGARVIIGIGLMASVNKKIKVGDLAIPSLALRDEGTSYHYLPPRRLALPSRSILRKLKESCERLEVRHHIGPIMTTDAPYRETPSKIRCLQGEAVLGFDMETSAIFSVAIYRKVMAGCILVASSNVTRPRGAGFYSPSLRKSVQKAIKISVQALKALNAAEATSDCFR